MNASVLWGGFMEQYFRVDVNLIVFVFFSVVLIIAVNRLDLEARVNRHFVWLSMIVLVQLIIEALTVIINTEPVAWFSTVSFVLHMVLFFNTPLLTFMWYRLVKKTIIGHETRRGNALILFLMPLIINTVFVLLTPFFGLIFTISEANVYARGPWFFVSALTAYFYLMVGIGQLIKHRHVILKQDMVALSFLVVLPVLGSIAQIAFYGILTLWSSMALSLVIVYLFLQERFVHLDHLTQAWTRATFDNWFYRRRNIEEALGLIFIDFDDLKTINDNYGHAEGDRLLKDSTKAIKDTTIGDEIFARLGGDEFMIVMKTDNEDRLRERVQLIRDVIAQRSQMRRIKYATTFSAGFGILSPHHTSPDAFIRELDKKMYREKQQHKNGGKG